MTSAAVPPPELRSLPRILSALAARLSVEQTKTQAREGAFSFVEHAWHLADLERDGFAIRIARLASEDHPSLPDFDGPSVAASRSYRSLDAREGVSAFVAARGANLERFVMFDAGALGRAGHQEGVGEVTLGDIPRKMLAHDRSHASELVDLLARTAPGAPEIAELRALADPSR